jgi:hypothetical protein
MKSGHLRWICLLGIAVLLHPVCLQAERRQITFTVDTESMAAGAIWDDGTLGAASGMGTAVVIIDTGIPDSDGSNNGRYSNAIESVAFSFAGNLFTLQSAEAYDLHILRPIPTSSSDGIVSEIPSPLIELFNNGVKVNNDYFFQILLDYPENTILTSDAIPVPLPPLNDATAPVLSVTKTSAPTQNSDFLFRLPILSIAEVALVSGQPANAAQKASLLRKIKKVKRKLKRARQKHQAPKVKRFQKQLRKLQRRLRAL